MLGDRFSGIIEHIFPRSFFEAAAANEVMQVVRFAVLFAIALTQVRGKPRILTAGPSSAVGSRGSSSRRPNPVLTAAG